jgi:hypothetical protein
VMLRLNRSVDSDTLRQGPRSAVGSPAPCGPLPQRAGHLHVRPMQFGPRLMRRQPPFGEPSESVDSLRTVLLSAPGVSGIKSIDLHHKGGFVAVMDFDRSSFDEFTNHIEAEGWMSVF